MQGCVNVKRTIISKLTLVLGLVLYAGILLGQEVVYKTLSKKDGLPSNTVYRVIEDSKGFIWIATDKGVCKFDGTELTCFTEEDGLAGEDVFVIFEDGVGRIWCLNNSHHLSCIINDSILNYINHGQIKQTLVWEDGGELVFRSQDSTLYIRNDNSSIRLASELTTGISNEFTLFGTTKIKYLYNQIVVLSDISAKTKDTLFFENPDQAWYGLEAFALNSMIIHNGPQKESYYILKPKDKTLERIWLNVDDDACLHKMINQYHRSNSTIQTYIKDKLFVYSTYQDSLEEIKIPNLNDNVNTALLTANNTLWLSTVTTQLSAKL